MTQPRVVVVGLGDTGVLTAIRLARHAEVMALTTKPGLVSGQELGLRLARPDTWMRDYRIDLDRFRGLDRVRTVHARATGLDLARRTVAFTAADGKPGSAAYDALVIATGVTNGFWRHPALQDEAAVTAELLSSHQRVAAASTIAVVGGGAAAMSAAAQLAERWPATSVHLYYPGDRGLPHHHGRVWADVAQRLAALGVVLHPRHRAVLPPGDGIRRLGEGPVTWSTGQPAADAEVVVWAVGRVEPNTSWLPQDLLDERGFVRVGPTLQAVGHSNVFAVGDVAATDPLRTSARNQGHKLVAHNVRAHLSGRALKSYRPPRRRWGSVLGAQRDGLVVFAPNGRRFRFPVWSVETLLQRFVVRRGIYGGVRAPAAARIPPRSSSSLTSRRLDA